jgi:hypothetical protein
MKRALILPLILVLFSFQVKADYTSASSEESLPILDLEVKSESQPINQKKSPKRPNKVKSIQKQRQLEMKVGLVPLKKKKVSIRTYEKLVEEDFARLDRELDVLK